MANKTQGPLTAADVARAFGVPMSMLEQPTPRSWSILLTSENNGIVGPLGAAFKHAGEKHERVQVMEIVEAGAPPAPGVDLAGLVRFDFVDLDGDDERFVEVGAGGYFLAHQVEARVAAAAPAQPVGEFQGYVDGEPFVAWADRARMPQVGDKLYVGAAPVAAQAGQVAPAVLSEDRLDRIARNYFSEQWAIQHAKDAIHDALTEARAAGQVAVEVDRQELAGRVLAAGYRLAGAEHLSARNSGKGGPGLEGSVARAEKAFVDAVDALAAAPSAPAVAQQAPVQVDVARDAARYRWLCENGYSRMPEDLAEAIDAANVGGGQLPKALIDQAIDDAMGVAAPAQAKPLPADWISVDERLPKGRYCLATYRDRAGKLRIIRAMYVRQFEIEASGDECDSETNEANDMEYLKAGWYEMIDNWGDYSSVHVSEGPVTHWTPLPPLPGAQASTAGERQKGGAA